jgi:MFS family permease
MFDSRLRTLLAVAGCIVVYALTLGFTTPLISLILEARGFDRTWIGLNAAMPSLSMLLFAPLVPAAVHRLGVRRLLILCLLGDVMLVLALGSTTSIALWFVIRFIMGATLGGLFIIGEAWINAVAEESARGRIIANYNAAYYVAAAVGPMMIPFTGTEGALPFMLAGGLLMLALVPLSWATDEGGLVQDERAPMQLAGFVRAAPVLVMTVTLFAVIEFIVPALLPVYGLRSGLSAAEAALCLTVVGIGRVILQFPVGRLADSWDRSALLAVCIGATFVLTLALPWAVVNGAWGFPVLVLWGGIYGSIYSVALTIVGERFRGQQLVVANASLAMIWGVGGIAGPGVAGMAMDFWDPHGMVAVLAVACAVTLGGMYALRGRW